MCGDGAPPFGLNFHLKHWNPYEAILHYYFYTFASVLFFIEEHICEFEGNNRINDRNYGLKTHDLTDPICVSLFQDDLRGDE